MKFTFAVIKKNHLLVGAVTMMLVVAGYLNYVYDPTRAFDVELTGKIEDSLGEAIYVSSPSLEKEDYFIKTRIERDNLYASQLESYEKLIKDNSVKDEQKKFAQEQIESINKAKTAISVSENLIMSKEVEKVVILVNNSSVNVVIKTDDLSDTLIAQIQNIITREFETDIKNVHIINEG